MSLTQVRKKRSLVIIGLNSGTSADGLDMAALQIASSTKRQKIRFISGRKRSFEPALKNVIHEFSDGANVTLDELNYLDNALGALFGRAAASFIRTLAARGIAVDAVVSHGQTVRHTPARKQVGRFTVSGTLQLGSPERVSAATGKLVVADLRQADVATGGEGAPITVEAMRRLFADRKEPRLIVNIGGIANFFYFPAGGNLCRVQAADCGPGNILSDLVSARLFSEEYDRSGRRASSGTISEPLLKLLLGQRFFESKSISTGREDFGPSLIKKMFLFADRYQLSGEDILATAAELTVLSIVHRIAPILKCDRTVQKLYLTGGGAHNKFMKRRLQEKLPSLRVCTVKELGFDPDLVEAAAYAVIGFATLHSEPMPTRFGSRSRQRLRPVLGRIVQPPQKM